MDHKRPGENLRKTVRCMVDDSRRQCELCVDARRITAWLQDESVGGFGILVEGAHGLDVGQEAELHTDTGWFIVRIMRVEEIDLSQLEGIEGGEQGHWYRLGLARLAVTAPPRKSTTWWPIQKVQRPERSSNGLLLAVIVFLAVFATVLSYGLMKLKEPSKSADTGRSTQWMDVKAMDNAPHRESSSAAPNRNKPASNRDSHTSSAPARLSDRVWQDLRSTLRRLPGPSPLTLPDVVEQLQLTPEQQRQIQRIVDNLAKAIRDLDRELAGRQRKDIDNIRSELLERARKEAVGHLTTQQRKIWDDLVGTSENMAN
jgi:hypothetical protein